MKETYSIYIEEVIRQMHQCYGDTRMGASTGATYDISFSLVIA